MDHLKTKRKIHGEQRRDPRVFAQEKLSATTLQATSENWKLNK